MRVLKSLTGNAVEENMIRAVWNGAVLAGSDRTAKLEGNHYFPPESPHREDFTGGPTTSTCPWKGQARYSHITVDSEINRDAAWYYPQPSAAASKIAGHVAFWHGVRAGRPAPGQGNARRRGPPPGPPHPQPAAPDGSAAVTSPARTPSAAQVYWRPGCPYCAMLRLGLRSAPVPATWVNIWEDRAAAARVRAITGGDETVPTVVAGTRALVNPSARQVIAAVRDEQPGTRPSAATRAAAWPARMAGFLSRRPRLGSPR